MHDRPVLLALTAHADDAEFFAGGTLARFASEGYRIIEAIATDNSRGSFELDSRTLIDRSRRIEAESAAGIIGKEEVLFLGYPDGYLNETPPNTLRSQYIKLIRQYRPSILMSFDPWAPFEPHPDHRHVAMAAAEAVAFSHMPLFHPELKELGLAPHMVAERYLFAKSPERTDRVVDISKFIEIKIDALCAHESQMRMTIDDTRMSIEATGKHADLASFLDRENYRPAIEMSIRSWAGGVGKKAGFEYGEEFRYEHAAAVLDGIGL